MSLLGRHRQNVIIAIGHRYAGRDCAAGVGTHIYRMLPGRRVGTDKDIINTYSFCCSVRTVMDDHILGISRQIHHKSLPLFRMSFYNSCTPCKILSGTIAVGCCVTHTELFIQNGLISHTILEAHLHRIRSGIDKTRRNQILIIAAFPLHDGGKDPSVGSTVNKRTLIATPNTCHLNCEEAGVLKFRLPSFRQRIGSIEIVSIGQRNLREDKSVQHHQNKQKVYFSHIKLIYNIIKKGILCPKL